MGKKKSQRNMSTQFDRARDELYSHILSCGVLEAAEDQQKDWFDDTMEYLEDRYGALSDEELSDLRNMGERFCRPVIKQGTEA